MAHYRQLPNGSWQAQVCKRGVRKSVCFPSKEEAERWAQRVEDGIKATLLGRPEAAIELTREEFTNIHHKAKENARQRGIEFALHRDQVVLLYGKSGGYCQVTGITFNRFRPAGSTKRPWYPSLDRIDSSKPYTFDNCRLVCVAANFAMGEWGEWVLKALSSSMVLGLAGNLRNGPEAAEYSFPALKDSPTPRQLSRRNARAKSPTDNPQNPQSIPSN